MSRLSIAITGDGQLFQIWPSHAMKRFPQATIYDRSATTTGFRQAEVKLGESGYLDPAGQVSARRTAENIAKPPEVDATVLFNGPVQNGTVTVTCKNGTEQVFPIKLNDITDEAVQQAFFPVDAAINQCKRGVAIS